jgi:tetratricopeptide (TPR) repeat protein
MEHTVTLVPESGLAHLYLSKCRLAQKDPQAAEESYDQAIKLDKKLKDIGYWIDIQEGLCKPLIGAGEFDRAIVLYENVLKELEGEPDTLFSSQYYGPRVRISMAEVYHQARKLDKAIDIYEEVLRKKKKGKRGFGLFASQDSHLYRGLGRIYREKGDEQKALLNEQKADQLERRSKRFMNFLSFGFIAILLGIAQFLLVLAACVYLSSRILILKKEKRISGASAKKVSWSFQDVLGTYAKAYFSPLALFFMAFVIALLCGSDLSGLFLGSRFAVPFLIGLLSLTLYWAISKKRFGLKFRQAYPDTIEEAKERPFSMLTLTLWQLLCVGTINIVSVAIAYGSIIGIVVAGSL